MTKEWIILVLLLTGLFLAVGLAEQSGSEVAGDSSTENFLTSTFLWQAPAFSAVKLNCSVSWGE